jgi:hypothetical protein
MRLGWFLKRSATRFIDPRTSTLYLQEGMFDERLVLSYNVVINDTWQGRVNGRKRRGRNEIGACRQTERTFDSGNQTLSRGIVHIPRVCLVKRI